MAKSITEQLLALLDPETQAKVKKALADNPKLAVDDRRMEELFSIYLGAEEEPVKTEPVKTEPVKTEPVKTEPVKTEPAKSEPHTPVAPAAAGGNAEILAALNGLKSDLTTRFDTLEKDVVRKSDLPNLESIVLGRSAKLAADVSTIMSTHKAEFGEDLDRGKFETWLDEQAKANAGPDGKPRPAFPSITKAYDAYVADKRTEAKIAKGIADGVKQKLSGQQVPGQTTSVALSPAQEIMRKAKETAAGGGKTNLQSAIDRLKQRDEAGAGAQVQ